MKERLASESCALYFKSALCGLGALISGCPKRQHETYCSPFLMTWCALLFCHSSPFPNLCSLALQGRLDPVLWRSLKRLLPMLSYYFATGPFRCLWIRYGYDPRKSADSGAYQGVWLSAKHNSVATLRDQLTIAHQTHRIFSNVSTFSKADEMDRGESVLLSALPRTTLFVCLLNI